MTESADRIHRSNAEAWNETSSWYSVRAEQVRRHLADGGSTLHKQEHKLLDLLPPLDTWCRLAIHLQCAAGFDTISLTNLGARQAVGVDIAEDLIRIATTLSKDLGAPTSFRCADVLEFHGFEEKADLVYTGKGAVHWMFDLAGWAAKVAELLRPGGWLLLFDFHPMMWLFRSGREGIEVNPVSYFAPVIRYRDWAPGHFDGVGVPPVSGTVKRIRPWPPSAVIQSLIGAGLEIAVFHEYPDSLAADWTAYPNATPEERARIASTYAVVARKPGGEQ